MSGASEQESERTKRMKRADELADELDVLMKRLDIVSRQLTEELEDDE